MRPYHVGEIPGNGGHHAKAGVEHQPIAKVSLGQNEPNPFNPMTTIRFSLDSSRHASLRVYDVSGRLVRTLVDRDLNAGQPVVVWDGKTEAGVSSPSGVYFYRLIDGERVLTRRMTLLR